MLCEICRTIPLAPGDFVIDPKADDGARYDDTYEIGTLKGVMDRSEECSLCHLVLTTAGLLDDPNLLTDQHKAMPCELYWQGDGLVDDMKEPRIRCLRLRIQRYPPGFNESHRMILHGDDASSGADSLFLGRDIPNQIDLRLLKKWLKTCQRWHGDECEVQISRDLTASRPLPANFHLIDTWRKCIITPQEDCEYIALSYVCGGSIPVVNTTKANMDEFMRPGALRRYWPEIPQTIKDAMCLTSALGRRYIWIDSFCIMQDDPGHKAAMIQCMNLIYERAFMTIIAATGDSPSVGLPGFGETPRKRRQLIETLRPGLRLLGINNLSDALEKSFYETRAWTYQERRLSRRCLYFIEGEAIFQCLQTFREDVKLERAFTVSFDHAGGRFPDGLRDQYGDPPGYYIGCLWEYCPRNLSFESDITDAFEGTLQRIIDTSNAQPSVGVCGIPAHLFDWAVLWEPGSAVSRRHNALPSWSWCGWKGEVTLVETNMKYTDVLTWIQQRTWIHWFVHGKLIDGSEAVIFIDYDQTERKNALFPIDRYPPVRVKSHKRSSDPSIFQAQKRLSPLQARLHFATISFNLHVIPTEPIRQSTQLYRICLTASARSSTVGFIWLPSNHTFSAADQFQFLAISQSRSARFKSVVEGLREKGDEYDAYNVMMIRPSSSTSKERPGERIALGIIFKEQMHESGEWKEIWLC